MKNAHAGTGHRQKDRTAHCTRAARQDEQRQLETASTASPAAATAVSGGTQEAVLAALMVLGYTTQAERLHAMEGLDTAGMEADEIIRRCLKKLVKS